MIYLEMNMWPIYKTFISLNISYLKKGTEIGSDANDNYNFRDKTLDDKTPMLMGNIDNQLKIGLNFKFRISELLYITGDLSYNDKK